MNVSDVQRRLAVAHRALPLVRAGRRLELAELPAAARVAVLAEAAGCLAAMARRQARVSHVDARQVACLVTDPVDAMAVLGRGRWLPTMQRRVLAIPAQVGRLHSVATPSSARQAVGQLSLFSTNEFRTTEGR